MPILIRCASVITSSPKALKLWYIFIVSSNRVPACSQARIFRVKGDGQKRPSQDISRLLRTDTNAFFRLWDADTDFGLPRISPLTGRRSGCAKLWALMCSDRYSHALSEYRLRHPRHHQNPNNVIRNAFRMMSILSPSFSIKNLTRPKGPLMCHPWHVKT